MNGLYVKDYSRPIYSSYIRKTQTSNSNENITIEYYVNIKNYHYKIFNNTYMLILWFSEKPRFQDFT